MKKFGGINAEFRDKEYSHAYVEELLNIYIATQIKVLREQREWSQEELADHAEMKQTRICLMENANYGSWSISTLKRLARAFDLVLRVSFDSFGTAIHEMRSLSRSGLQRTSRTEELEIPEESIGTSQVVIDLANYATHRNAGGQAGVAKSGLESIQVVHRARKNEPAISAPRESNLAVSAR